MEIRPLKRHDLEEWVRLRVALWPDADQDEVAEEIPAWLEDGDPRLFSVVVDREDGRLGGYMECSLRLQAEGCLSSPVAYIENWYVDEDLRRQGISGQLLEAVGRWARYRGCAEIASACVLGNDIGEAVHEALGFEEVDRLIHYVYELPAEG